MNSLRFLPHGSLLLGLALGAFSALSVVGCADHERVVVHDRPIVQERVVAPPPVVHEQVIVRP